MRLVSISRCNRNSCDMRMCGPSKSHKLLSMKEMLVGAVGIESGSLKEIRNSPRKGSSKFGHPRSGRKTRDESEKGGIRIDISNRPGRRHPILETVEAATQRFMKLQAQSSTPTFN